MSTLTEALPTTIITGDTMSNESQASHFPGYFSTNNGDQVAAQIALANLTRESALDEVGTSGICDLRHEVADAASNVKDAIHAQSLANGMEFCGVNRNVSDKACEIMKNDSDHFHRSAIQLADAKNDLNTQILTNRSYLTKEIGDGTYRVIDRVDRDSEILRTQMLAFERSNSEKLCKLEVEGMKNTREILDRLSSDKLDEKNNEILKLRTRHSDHITASNFALQNQTIASLKQMIDSIEQTQKFTNKTSVFASPGAIVPNLQTASQA